jgi:hypothetical protein
MLSYETAERIPILEKLLILNAIDSRDKIIDNALTRIEVKYNELLNDNKKLKDELAKCEESKPMKKNYTYGYHNNILPDSVLTESTRKGYELCKPFESYDYDIKSNDLEFSHKKIYDDLRKIIAEPGNEIILNHCDVDSKNIDFDPCNIDDVEYDYDQTLRKKRFLSSLIGLTTDYVSDNVYVEKVLEALDNIVNYLNKDTEFINYVLNGLFDSKTHKCRLSLIFKGGNVYKLFTQIISDKMSSSVFGNYMTDIEQYFKKSDCDFGLIFITTNIATGEEIILHFDRTDSTENIISVLLFMILNKFRNDFLRDRSGYEYVNICGANDVLMMKRTSILANKMLSTIVEGRLEFETILFELLLKYIQFIYVDPDQNPRPGIGSSNLLPIKPPIDLNIFAKYKNITTYFADKINIDTYATQTLIGLLSENANKYVAMNQYGVINATIVEWYSLFLAYCFRDKSYLISLDKFQNAQLPRDILKEIQSVKTDSMEWRDVKVTYNTKNISNIIIGDNIYPLSDTNNLSNRELFVKLMENDIFPDNIVERNIGRIKHLQRVSSNRNDFFLKFSKKKYIDPSGILIIEDIIHTALIPFDKNQRFITPFYISINKEITAPGGILLRNEGSDGFLLSIKRLSEYGSNGYVKRNSVYSTLYDKQEYMLKKNKEKNKTLDFGLSRLMLNFMIILETYDNKYYSISVPSEYIDLSYSYNSDIKTRIYESYNGYTLLNGNYNKSKIITDDMILFYKKIINFVTSGDYSREFTQKFAVNVNTAIILDDLKRLDITKIQNDVIIEDYFKQYQNINKMSFDTFLKIIKYYTYYKIRKAPQYLSFKSVYFPKLHTYILDLYSILFIDSEYPWIDRKYIKRLQRYIFFIFIESLQEINTSNIDKLLLDIGVITSMQDLVYMYNDMKRQPGMYTENYSYQRAIEYIKYRSTHMVDMLKPVINEDRIIISSGGIDHFMFSYHLLDFIEIHKKTILSQKYIKEHDTIYFNYDIMYIREQFIVKKKATVADDGMDGFVYILVVITEQEQINNIAYNLLVNVPNILQFNNNIINPNIVLNNGQSLRRYRLIENDLLGYINICEDIKEKLIITIFNYIYDINLSTTHKMNIVPIDPIQLLLNTYEGNIDKILTVVN